MSAMSCEDALKTITTVLTERVKELDIREEQLQKEREQLEIERSTVYGDTKPSDVIHLNVGGTKFVTLRRTLTSVPGSMLASKFSGRWDDNMEKDKDGNFLIDQQYSLFSPMLIYLRNKANSNGDPKYPIESPHGYSDFGTGLELNDFYRMVEYYGMTDGLYPTVLNLIYETAQEQVVIESKQAIASEWATLQLVPVGHSRSVKTFEVTLGDVQRVQIGWMYHEKELKTEELLGVGEIQKSAALDLTRSSIIVNGDRTAVARLAQSNGTTVRCEDYGKKWYVDGQPVSIDGKNTLMPKHVSAGYPCPTISIEGDIEITFTEFSDHVE